MSSRIRRKIDELGRVVIPIDIRNKFDIKEKDQMEIFVYNDKIILKKYEPICVFCGKTKELKEFQKKLICSKCMNRLVEKDS